MLDGELREGDEDEPSCFVIRLDPDDNCECRCRVEFNGGEEADSFLNSFFIASDDEDEAGVRGGGPLLVLVGFFDLDPMLSDDESCAF